MSFPKEPTGYEKTAMSDLQGAWINFRDSIVQNFGFNDSDKILFYTDEAMSWENVRDLNKMNQTLILIQNISNQTNIPEDVNFWLNEVRENLTFVLSEIKKGEIL